MCTEKIIFMAGNTHEYVAKEGNCDLFCRRAPHGARGLKRRVLRRRPKWHGSRPARGAWIETAKNPSEQSHRSSRPARGAWIETRSSSEESQCHSVAPRTGRVD